MLYIRNFCIIAHIDHGKSTLADRLLDYTETINKRKMQSQVLDDMDLERERGITIKSHAIRMHYVHSDNHTYILNLIDTPGHVDFSYEVSRALKACEGVLLIIDASQGIEAQTLSNLYQALDLNLKIIPILNKIDLPGANVDLVSQEVSQLMGINPNDILKISAKENIGIDSVINQIIDNIPPPLGDPNKPLKALIFDSTFNMYRGAIPYIKIFDGTLKQGDTFRFMSNKQHYHAEEIGYRQLTSVKTEVLSAGEVGYVIGNVKSLQDIQVGDTITHERMPAEKPIVGYKKPRSMVFCGLYPIYSEQYENLYEALKKLQLNDASLNFEPETSHALGFGFRVGFLGLLHMDIVKERLSREYAVDIITTVPNVEYKVILKNKKEPIMVDNPIQLPTANDVNYIMEPIINATIITPITYIGAIMKICQQRRGKYVHLLHLSDQRAELKYELPLAEIVYDFYGQLKGSTQGYASFDYDFSCYRQADLVKLDIFLNSKTVDALSTIIHRKYAYNMGKKLCKKLVDIIPRQQYEVIVQAGVGKKILSRENVRALRKDVTAKCYGGDVSRKRKLLQKQKEGKKKMKQVGNIELPQEAFMAILSVNNSER